MPILTIRLSTELHARFMEECGKRDINASELGRRAIENVCQKMVDAGDPPTAVFTSRAGLEKLHELAGTRRAHPSARGFAVDGSGEITQEQLAKNRQSELVRTKGKAKP